MMTLAIIDIAPSKNMIIATLVEYFVLPLFLIAFNRRTIKLSRNAPTRSIEIS